jgi:hypothetical protein
MVDDMIAGQLDEFSGVIAAFTAELPSFFMCLVVHLCISVSHCCRCVSARASMTDRTDATSGAGDGRVRCQMDSQHYCGNADHSTLVMVLLQNCTGEQLRI